MDWIEKPLTFKATADQTKVYDFADGSEIGEITHSEQHYNRRISLTMRSIRVKGSNGVLYHGRYAAEKSSVVVLKRCGDRPPRYRPRRHNRAENS